VADKHFDDKIFIAADAEQQEYLISNAGKDGEIREERPVKVFQQFVTFDCK